MDVLGFLKNLSDTTKFCLTVTEDIRRMKNAPKDVRNELDYLQMVAQHVDECLRAVTQWKTSGYEVGHDLELQLRSTVSALGEAAVFLKNAVQEMESENRARSAVARTKYLLRGKESISSIVNRVKRRAEILFQRVFIQPIFHSNRLSRKYISFIKDAWDHSRTAKPLSWTTTVKSGSLSLLPYSDEIAVGTSLSGFDGDVFVGRSLRAEKEHTERLYKMLSAQGPERLRKELGLLECIGYANVEQEAHVQGYRQGDFHALIFRRPDMTETPCTLRELLVRDGAGQHRLSDRLRLALTITTSVVVDHSLGIIHKLIAPETILMFSKMRGSSASEEQSYDLGTPYLLAFDEARTEEMISGGAAVDINKRRRFYCHPDHLVDERRRPFEIRDDVVGLGICLLEIGLWKSFFRDDECATEPGRHLVMDGWVKSQVDARSERTETSAKLAGWRRIAKLKDLAITELPRIMGDLYTEAVVACLDCEVQPAMQPGSQELPVQRSGDSNQAERVTDGSRWKVLPNISSLRRQYLYFKTALFGQRVFASCRGAQAKGQDSQTYPSMVTAEEDEGEKDKDPAALDESRKTSPSCKTPNVPSLEQAGKFESSPEALTAVESAKTNSGRLEESSARVYGDELRQLSKSAMQSIHLVTQILMKLESIKL